VHGGGGGELQWRVVHGTDVDADRDPDEDGKAD